MKYGAEIGIRDSFGDIGATICELLRVPFTGVKPVSKARCRMVGGDPVMFNMSDIIYKKERAENSREEIQFLSQIMSRRIPDYQASALLMAIFFRGLSRRETFELTDAMRYSGDTVDLSSIPGIKVDKHSTGGVGDKTTLIVAPLASACGVPIAKMSGRGLGFTGGTVDKMESIPGFRTSLEPEAFLAQVRKIGMAVIGQTAHTGR